jgi:colanic acid biosynthesis glycosyl transferase WcaI
VAPTTDRGEFKFMRILILNQAFYPDVVSVAQHAADLASELAKRGHDVTALASRRAYDCPSQTFPPSDLWRGVRILRVQSTAFGKGNLWRRASDFLSFYLSCIVRLAALPKFDAVIAMTVPPLISVVAAAYIRLRGGALISWVMDLNPDEAIAAGALKETSIPTKALSRLLRFSLSSSKSVIVLDRFMQDRIAAKGVPLEQIFVIPPWSHDSVIHYDHGAREQFRCEHKLTGKFVVMYSGNHSPCHPLDTLLAAAQQLRANTGIVFVFVGGGSQFLKVKEFASRNSLNNILCLPYQPLDKLAGSLSAADLHIVVMGDKFVGTVHPCKIYNILATGSPFLYIGPSPNHITELAGALQSKSAYHAAHGQTEAVVSHIVEAAENGLLREVSHAELAEEFSEKILIPRLIWVIEQCAPPTETLPTNGVISNTVKRHPSP